MISFIANLLAVAPPPFILSRTQKSDVGKVTALWSSFESVYGSRELAEAAARRNPQVLLPFLNSPATIKGAHRTLVDLFGAAGAADIISKNPGVLACDPNTLAKTPKSDIVIAANVVSIGGASLGGLPVGVWAALVAAAVGKLLQGGEAWDLQGGLGPQLQNFLGGIGR